jgi:hypothetical protein
MKRFCLAALAVLAVAVTAFADEDNVHHMRLPDGELDTDKCGFCHEDDFSLSNSKLETCTLCHDENLHSGIFLHQNAAPAEVARLQGDRKDAWPLTDEGRVYCGTCHLFHDPTADGEEWLPKGRALSMSPFAVHVRDGIVEKWKATAQKRETEAAAVKPFDEGTRALRMPVENNELCRHCHEGLP